MPITVRHSKSAILQHPIHLAGTYNGIKVRFFVDGELVNEVEKNGFIVRSPEMPTVGSRSASDPGGYFVGLIHELRAWREARTIEEIDFWRFRILPLPAPPECDGFWNAEVQIGLDQAISLKNKGLSHQEIALASFITRYVSKFIRLAPNLLTGQASLQFLKTIYSCVLVKASDGYLALYEPSSPTYVQAKVPDITESLPRGTIFR